MCYQCSILCSGISNLQLHKKDDFTKRMSEKKLKKLKDEITSYCVITSSELVR